MGKPIHLTCFSFFCFFLLTACSLVNPEPSGKERETGPVVSDSAAGRPTIVLPTLPQTHVPDPPTNEPGATVQPQDGPPMTMPQLDLPENYPDPDHMTAEGLQAYRNFLPVLLNEDEINPLFNAETRTWEFNFDGPDLYRTCRVFLNFHHFLEQYFYFFSCVYQMVPGFDLMTGDPGLYEVLEVYPSAHEMAVPSAVVRYRSPMGFEGIDRIFQVGQFIYITGVWIDVNSMDNLFNDFLDQFLFETANLMLAKALASPPAVLEFPEGAVAEKIPDFAGVLIQPGDFKDWAAGEPDEKYPEGVCRTLYHTAGPPPVLLNCAFRISAATYTNWLSYQMQGEFIDISDQTRFAYDASYAMFVNYTEGGYPRVVFAMFSDEMILSVEVISPFLQTGENLANVFTAETDELIQEIIQLNQLRQRED